MPFERATRRSRVGTASVACSGVPTRLRRVARKRQDIAALYSRACPAAEWLRHSTGDASELARIWLAGTAAPQLASGASIAHVSGYSAAFFAGRPGFADRFGAALAFSAGLALVFGFAAGEAFFVEARVVFLGALGSASGSIAGEGADSATARVAAVSKSTPKTFVSCDSSISEATPSVSASTTPAETTVLVDARARRRARDRVRRADAVEYSREVLAEVRPVGQEHHLDPDGWNAAHRRAAPAPSRVPDERESESILPRQRRGPPARRRERGDGDLDLVRGLRVTEGGHFAWRSAR